MKGLGILINALAVFVAGGTGIIFRGKLKPSFQRLALEVVGMIAILLGGYNAWDAFFVVTDSQFELKGTILVAFSLLVGAIFGEAWHMERKIDRIGALFQNMSRRNEEKDAARAKGTKKEVASTADEPNPVIPPTYDKTFPSRLRKLFGIPPKGTYPRFSELPVYDLPETRSGSLFLDGFAVATLLLCCNAMCVTGALAEATAADSKILIFKAILDAIMIFVLASIYGNGVTFAALPMLILEAGIFLIGLFKPALLLPSLGNQLNLIGSVMLIGVGVNLTFGKRLRVANLTPALLIPPLYALIIFIQKTSEK